MDLREAIHVLVVEESVGDFIYEVRERAISNDPTFHGSSWFHPRVTRWNAAVMTLKAYLERSPE